MSSDRHLCPECGSNNIYYSKGSTNVLAGSVGTNHILITQGAFPQRAAVDTYVCADCGYVRSFVSDRFDLERIIAKWTPLNK